MPRAGAEKCGMVSGERRMKGAKRGLNAEFGWIKGDWAGLDAMEGCVLEFGTGFTGFRGGWDCSGNHEIRMVAPVGGKGAKGLRAER